MEKKLYSKPIVVEMILGCPIMRAFEPSNLPDDSTLNQALRRTEVF